MKKFILIAISSVFLISILYNPIKALSQTEVNPDNIEIQQEIAPDETENDSKFYTKIIDWYMDNLNYFTLTVLMTIESSFIPFPSEVVVPPAAWKAAQGEMNIFLVVFFATLGALIGALINYYLGLSLGRLIIYKLADTRLAHFFLIDRSKIEKAEQYFVKHGKSSTLVGRLVPGIRQLISVPAGMAKMKLGSFILFTCIGAGIWNIILAIIGYFLYSQKELLHKYYNELSIALIVLGCLFVIYLVYNGLKKKKTVTNDNVEN
jgi:membrane protein DedA with SNARE-associated domain